MARWVRDERTASPVWWWRAPGGSKKKECNEAMTKAITGVLALIGGVLGEGVAQLQ